MPRIDVCLSPALYPTCEKSHTDVVVLDAIRASSSICSAFENGVKHIIPVSDERTAMSYQSKGYVISGERDGDTLPGFDLGNSPQQFTPDKIGGQALAMTTTNGTQAIHAVQSGNAADVKLYIGSFNNFSALLALLNERQRDILLLCSGWKGAINTEDTLLAGKITKGLLATSPDFTTSESAKIALQWFASCRQSYYDFILQNSPRIYKKSRSLSEDFKFCLIEDNTRKVPYLQGDKLIV